MLVKEIGGADEKERICADILAMLPSWFGIPESTAEYIRDSRALPMLAAVDGDTIAAFLSLKQHNPYSAEIYVMGARPEYHRSGTGRLLIRHCEEQCRENGVELLQVKTLDESFPDKYYARTRAFYAAMGFRPLECMKALWGEHCPCLVMIKSIH